MAQLFSLGIMTTPTPMFACFAGNRPPELDAIIYVIVGTWITALALGCINFILICLTGDRRFKTVHFSSFAVYAAATAAMYFRLIPDALIFLFWVIGLGVPPVAIAHFVVLLRARRRFHNGKAEDAQ